MPGATGGLGGVTIPGMMPGGGFCSEAVPEVPLIEDPDDGVEIGVGFVPEEELLVPLVELPSLEEPALPVIYSRIEHNASREQLVLRHILFFAVLLLLMMPVAQLLISSSFFPNKFS